MEKSKIKRILKADCPMCGKLNHIEISKVDMNNGRVYHDCDFCLKYIIIHFIEVMNNE